MTFTFNPSIIGGQVQTVSAYVTDNVGAAGIYAYDASNNLFGSAVLPGTGAINVLLSVTTSGAPIAYVTVHNDGTDFAIDNFTFIWTATCSGSVEQLQSTIAALPASDFKVPRTAPAIKQLMLDEIILLEKLVANNAKEVVLLADLNALQVEVNATMVAGSDKTAVLALIEQIITTARAGQCHT
jgi:hypothetical protein